MPARVIGTANAEHYTWGGAKAADADAWYLVQTPELNVIEERMPSGIAETPHHHVRARQFFFVLEGELSMMVEHHDYTVRAGEGIEVSPGQLHLAANRSDGVLRVLVTSQPPSHGDRVER
ncbi:MAG: cupin domain-containing protein [Acidobacteriota bacterium]|nr:cupin domain-containing protein [Acidobacteriota bacterium]